MWRNGRRAWLRAMWETVWVRVPPSTPFFLHKNDVHLLIQSAGVAELADARDSKSRDRNIVWVRPPSPVPFIFGGNNMNATTANLLLIVVLIAVMYFVMIRPQQKQDKKNKEMRESLKIGDEIITIGGIVGRITKITDKTVTIQTGNPNTKLEIIKGSVGNVVKKGALDEEKAPEKKHEEEEVATPSRDKKVTPKKLTKKSE